MKAIRVAEGSEVIVGRGLPEDLLPVRAGRLKTAIVTQPGPAGDIASRVASLAPGPFVVEVPDRDHAKQLEVLGLIYDRLVEENLGRGDTIMGVGGGAVTDLAGFAAATWLRGVESVLVPTTLLGAVDAAIGGKTGINRQGKNLVGAFWHPTRVVVDLDTLDALPHTLKVEGSAEIIKAGYLADRAIIAAYSEAGPAAPLADVVPRAIAVKAAIVREDFRETGARALLNLGHTLGHAVEISAGLPHGHAVSIGMVAAAAISEARYGFDRPALVSLLEGAGLPTSARGVSRRSALALVARDKKREVNDIRMVLLKGIEDPVIDVVTPEEIDLGLAAIDIR